MSRTKFPSPPLPRPLHPQADPPVESAADEGEDTKIRIPLFGKEGLGEIFLVSKVFRRNPP